MRSCKNAVSETSNVMNVKNVMVVTNVLNETYVVNVANWVIVMIVIK